MSTMHEWLATESAWWWPRLADHLWQATLFALVVFAASLVLRSGPARIRHTFWVLASLKLLIPAAFLFLVAERAGANFSGSLLATIPAAQESVVFHSVSGPVAVLSNNYQITVQPGHTNSHNELYCALTAIWISGVLLLTTLWWMRRRKFLQALKTAQPVCHGRELLAFKRACALLGSTSRIELVLAQNKAEPAVGRIWRPVVILPGSIGEHLSDRELEAIMLHELVHVQRHDNLIGTFQMVVLALFWFHPLAWFISRRLISEREQACDEKVLAMCDSPDAYASSILKVVRFSFGWKTAGVSGAGNGSNLRRRITNIMSLSNTKGPGKGMKFLAAALIAFAVALTVVMGANKRVGALAAVVDETGTILPGPMLTQKIVKPTRPPEPAEPPPPPPPQPTQQIQSPPPPPQPGQPAQEASPVQAPQPPQPGQPTKASPPSPPAPPTPGAPASPVSNATAPSSPAPPARPATPAPEADRKRGRIDEKVNLIEAPQPVYPIKAMKNRVSGTVIVTVEIDEDGHIVSAKAQSGPEALRSAAIEAAFKARFDPPKVNGKPAKVNASLSYNFDMPKDDC